MVGGATPEQAGLGYVRKQTWKVWGASQYVVLLYSFCFSSCLQVPALCSCSYLPS